MFVCIWFLLSFLILNFLWNVLIGQKRAIKRYMSVLHVEILTSSVMVLGGKVLEKVPKS